MFEILLSLSRGQRSAGAILDEVAASRDGKRPPITSFYRKLRRALESGWVEIGSPTRSGPGRPSQPYRITAAGSRALEAEARRLQQLAGLALSAPHRESDR